MRVRLLLIAALPLLSGCLADLRPDALQEQEAPAREDAARALLARASAAHQGEGAVPWKELPGVEVELVDTYSGLIGSIACPWPNDPQTLTLRFLPGRDAGVAAFQDGDETVRWGLHEWNAWIAEGADPPEYRQDDDVLFWLPTLQYFLEMPFRLPEAGVVEHGGREPIDGEPCERVYLTWGSYGPRGDVDQYLAWVREEDGLLVRCAFTVRDVAPFAQGAVRYSDFRAVAGYLLPHRIEIGGDPPGELLHVLEVSRWRVPAPLPRGELAPDPGRPPLGKPGP